MFYDLFTLGSVVAGFVAGLGVCFWLYRLTVRGIEQRKRKDK